MLADSWWPSQVINLYGIFFVDDNHIEILAAGCIHLECLALNFCTRVKGASFKSLLQRCRQLQCLLLQNTGRMIEERLSSLHDLVLSRHFLTNRHWRYRDDQCWLGNLGDQWTRSFLDGIKRNLPSESICSHAQIELSRRAQLRWLHRSSKVILFSLGNAHVTLDQVLDLLIDQSKLTNLRVIDLSNTVNLNFDNVFTFLKRHGRQLRGLSYGGNPKITEQFWINAIRHLKNIRYNHRHARMEGIMTSVNQNWGKRVI